jgi:hypothetical protein
MSSYHKTQVIKKLNPALPPASIKDQTFTIGEKLSLSGNTTVAATGAGVSTGSTNVGNAVNGNNSAKIAAKSSTTTLKNTKKSACDVANAAGVVLMQQFPNDPDLWITYGFEVTEEMVADIVKPGQAIHCSASQGDDLGTADIHHDPVPDADDYQVWVTNGVVGVRSGYIDVTNYEESTSKSSTTVTLPAGYIGVPLNFIIVARNSAGSGIDSVPFGGGRKIN